MKTEDFNYHLPAELIAQTPVEPRDSSRMLVLDRPTGDIDHTRFENIVCYFRTGDLLVLNDSRVISGRIYAREKDGYRSVELLLLRRLEAKVWEAIGRPGRRLKPGTSFIVPPTDIEVDILERRPDGTRVILLSTEEGMEEWGHVPLPPYIHKPLYDAERYQTVYAREPGSAAAPTAGLHFTKELLESLESLGVDLTFLTLHVGLDTFRSVEEEDPRKHKIHTEYLSLDIEVVTGINAAKREGRRVIAVGTTAVRGLEQAALWADAQGVPEMVPTSGYADLMILPGHQFLVVDAMITNFHLPRSTTLMLTNAFAGAGRLMAAYREAITNRYRFYSFGDAMLII